jgi:hypothetical protein
MTPEQIARELPFVLSRDDGEGIRQLFEGGLNINARNHNGISLLQEAALDGKLAVVRALVELGADMDAQGGPSQMTALHFATQRRHKEIALLLIERGANPNCRDNTGETPLHLAAYAGLPDMARALVDAGADLQARDNRKMTPWEVAQNAADERFEFANQEFYATAVLLAEAEKQLDAKKQSADALTALKSHPYKNFRLGPGR